MSHVRTQVRNAVIARLETADAFQLVAPFGRTARQFQRDELPAALVQVSETVNPVNKVRPRTLRRDMTVSVMLMAVSASGDLDALLDDMSVSVEQALAEPEALGLGKLVDWRLTSTTPGAAEMAEANYATLTLTYACSISTLEGVPTTNIHA